MDIFHYCIKENIMGIQYKIVLCGAFTNDAFGPHGTRMCIALCFLLELSHAFEL